MGVVEMTRSYLSAAVLAAVLAASPVSAAFAQDHQHNATVAGAFMAAAQAQDRRAALQLLDEQVSIQFPSRSSVARQGHAHGQPFVIGYLDGLFDSQRALSLDGGSTARAGAVRFLAHDTRSNDRYAIDVEVRDEHVVRVTVNLEGAATDQTVASLDPS
jgi:hypothetical protein